MERPSSSREHAHAIASAIGDYIEAHDMTLDDDTSLEAYTVLVARIEAALEWAKDCAAVAKRNAFD